MKKVTLLLFTIISAFHSFSQDYKNGVGVHFTGIDFYGPQTGNYLLQDKLNESTQKTVKKLFWEPSVSASYWHSFNKYFDLSIGMGISALQYPTSNKDSLYIKTKLGTNNKKNEIPFVAADAKVHFNLLPKHQYILSPYLAAGLSGTLRDSDLGLDIPAGLGLNIKLSPGVFLNLESNYRVAISKVNQNHLTHSAGVVYWWKSNKKPQAPIMKLPEPPVIKDVDNDGIIDSEDNCPNVAGKREMKGCPDRDNDGVADGDDLCPDVKGFKQFNGCPDSDNDGIQDSKDNCPSIAGIAKYQGCPIPDKDNDGFNDEVDKCPEVASNVNNGCPEVKQEDKKKIEMAAKGVNFETGSAVIKSSSFDDLNNIVTILQTEPTYLVDIEGHTDNTGKSEKNIELSQQRADACKKYLVQKGIAESRISSVGYGDMKPIGDNSTKEGRAKNRRTEFNIKSY